MEDDLISLDPERRFTAFLKTLIVVRHAESLANTEGIFQGHTYDTDLSDLGKQQAQALARRAKELGISRIISSPLKRTYQTAIEVSKVTDRPIEISDLIIETNHGVWEGKPKTWISENYPEIYDAWYKAPSTVSFPGGEPFTETFNRVNAFLQSTDLNDRTLLVTHDNILRILVTLANGWTLDEIWRHDIEPASLNFFEVGKRSGATKLKILKLNDNKHLKKARSNLKKHAL